MKKPFIPIDFKVPETLETDKFRLRPLMIRDAAKDYDAVMTSLDHLRGLFGGLDPWPFPPPTLEQESVDLGWHQKEFQRRTSFTFTVESLDGNQCLGCVYLFPPSKDDFDAEVYMWVRKSEFEKGLDQNLFEAVKEWLVKKWPFEKVAYPGREIAWNEWESLT